MSTAPLSSLLRDVSALRATFRNDIVIPANAIPWGAFGSIVCPALGTQAVICSYQVQAGWSGFLTGVFNDITGDGASFIQGSGDVVWLIDVDIPLGNPLATGRFLPGYSNIIRTLGSFAIPWPIVPVSIPNRGWSMHPDEIWRYKVTPVATVPVGTPCFLHAYFGGVVWPNC